MQFEQIQNIFNPDLLQHIQFFELIRLCQTSKSWQNICHNRNTWIFLIKRDLIDPIETQEEEIKFLEQNVFAENGQIDPKDYYEYHYVVNFDYHDFGRIVVPENFDSLRKQYIINKLVKFSKTQPIDRQTRIYDCETNDRFIITGFNKYDIIYKYLLNVGFREDGDLTYFQDLNITLNYGRDHPNINTFNEFFEFLADDYYRGLRIDNIPHY